MVEPALNQVDAWYKELMSDVLANGTTKTDRTGTGTISVFGRTFRHKMSEGFPLLTSKKMYMKGVIAELLWFLKGSSDIRELWEMDCHIWDGDWYKRYVSTCSSPYTIAEIREQVSSGKHYFTDSMFDLGPIYGKQWTNWNGELNQISHLIEELKSNPDSRRLMVTAWNPTDLGKMVLPPCHYGFQCYTREFSVDERVAMFAESRGWISKRIGYTDIDAFDLSELTTAEIRAIPIELTPAELALLDKEGIPKRELSLSWNQRSVDVPLGLPFNIASYGLLLEMLAQEVGMKAGDLIGNLGDTHIYLNQLEGVHQQLNNETYPLGKLKLKEVGLFEHTPETIRVQLYESAGKVNYPLSN